MNTVLAQQLSVDFCCSVDEVLSRDNVFTVYQQLPGRRIFHEGECFLKAASVNGKLLMTGRADIIMPAKERFCESSGAWFMDMAHIRELDALMSGFGCRVGQAHPFYIATDMSQVDTGDLEIRYYSSEELEQFRGDDRFDEAFVFKSPLRDELGIAALRNGKILGMAGATGDSSRMWQIGINVLPEAEGNGIGSMLVALIKNRILEMGILPFYGTAMSHIVSQRTALKAGFLPAWSELCCEKR